MFLGARQLVLNNISHLISEKLMLFVAVNLVRAVVCFLLRMLCLCRCYIVLKEGPMEPMYSFSLTFVFDELI